MERGCGFATSVGIYKNKPMAQLTEQFIKQKIELIMVNHGPDGHTDGSGYITTFIIAILNGKHQQWLSEYQKILNKKELDKLEYQKQQEEE